jgi:endonuclease/exonuclease/phosphatase (EEP) superfamily protein YafD
MTHQGRDFVLIGTHPPPPGGREFAAERDRQLGQLAEHVALTQMPVLVVGDLNATPWSAGMRIATGRNLGFRSLRPPWTPTWRAASIFAIPIDHALCTAPLVIVGRSVGPDVGSDHRSLNIAVGWAR